jgi:hypothetical protein
MSVRSINEPNSSRLFNFAHPSINEPPVLPSMEAPTLTNIDPDTAMIGGPDITMTVTGSNFTPASSITFNGGLETTVFVDRDELTTIVKPSTATTPGTYPVTVVDGDRETVAAGFTFTPAGEAAAAGSWGADYTDPDELEDEIEQAEEEGEFKSLHVSKTVSVKKTKTKR